MRPCTFASAFIVALGISIADHPPANAQASDAPIADLVQSGKLRIGVGVIALHWAVKNPQTGELRGVSIEIARALAKRLGVEMVAIEYPSPPSILTGLNTNAWDVGFLAIDPARATIVDFSPPFLQIDATYLVPDGSAIRVVADADKPGIRIAVTSKSVEETVLRRVLKQAELVGVETIGAGFDLLREGRADVLAAPRPALIPLSSRLTGSRLLEDRFNTAYGAIAVPKGQAARLAYISAFVEEAKASGLVQQAIDGVGVRGVRVAPAGNPSAQ